MSHDHAETKAPTNETSSSLPVVVEANFLGGGWYDLNHNSFFSRYLFLTIVMIIWPWIFFGVVWGVGGIQLHNSRAEDNPKDTLYFATAISNIIGLITAYLFSKAVASLAQKRVVHKSMAIAEVSFFTALKNRVPSFSLFRRGRRRFLLMVVLYLIIFALITPGLTALLTPIHFTRKIQILGKELDFASNDTDCINWFQSYPIPDNCNWVVSCESMF
jgi:Na+/H+-dicarboxylate symporter